jgi:hypothetical protein
MCLLVEYFLKYVDQLNLVFCVIFGIEGIYERFKFKDVRPVVFIRKILHDLVPSKHNLYIV